MLIGKDVGALYAILLVGMTASLTAAADATPQEVEAATKRIGIYWDGVQAWERKSVVELPKSVSVLNFSPASEDGKSHAFTIISADSLDEAESGKSARELLKFAYANLKIESVKSVKMTGTEWTRAIIVNDKPSEDPMRLTLHIYAAKVGTKLKMVTLTMVGPEQKETLALFEKAIESVKLEEPAASTR